MITMDAKEYREMHERIRMLSDIALSAVALKLNIEHGFTPSLHALNRDLGMYQRRFGGVVEMAGKAALAMDDFECLCIAHFVNGECPIHGDAAKPLGEVDPKLGG